MTQTTINPAEAAHFGALAADWWDPKGSSAMLHKLNPARLAYVRGQVDAHFGTDPRERQPLAGKRVLDVGCGAGLLTEPLARLGGTVTGVDAAPENVAAARDHAAGQGLDIQYFAGELDAVLPFRPFVSSEVETPQRRARPEGLSTSRHSLEVYPERLACQPAEGLEANGFQGFDMITSMEVIEHVTDPGAFIAALAARLAPGGILILSTPNRTAASRLLLVEAAERVGAIPRGTHDWDKFLKPDELKQIVGAAGLEVTDTTALSLSPAKGFKLGGSDALNYLMTARRA